MKTEPDYSIPSKFKPGKLNRIHWSPPAWAYTACYKTMSRSMKFTNDRTKVTCPDCRNSRIFKQHESTKQVSDATIVA